VISDSYDQIAVGRDFHRSEFIKKAGDSLSPALVVVVLVSIKKREMPLLNLLPANLYELPFNIRQYQYFVTPAPVYVATGRNISVTFNFFFN